MPDLINLFFLDLIMNNYLNFAVYHTKGMNNLIL